MIPFVDLKAQYRSIKDEVDPAVAGVLASSQFALGDAVAAFETDFACYCGVDYAIAVNSGTSALHLALLAAGVGPGDEVITVPHTFVATAAAILYTGARPVYVDIDPITFNMDPEALATAITEYTKAVLPVHLYGQPADMDTIAQIARNAGLKVIEDAAQAHGAEYKGKRTGGLGDLGCFSFYPGKNLGAYGEGGAVTTNDGDYARTIRMLRDWGQDGKYNHVRLGFNARMDGIQGAVLGVKLRHLEDWTEARRAHAARYDEMLSGIGVPTPKAMDCARHVYHIYAIRVKDRTRVQAALQERGVQTGIHYPIPVHMQPGYADPRYGAGDFPHSESAAAEVLSLPMFAELTDDQIDAVATAVREALDG